MNTVKSLIRHLKIGDMLLASRDNTIGVVLTTRLIDGFVVIRAFHDGKIKMYSFDDNMSLLWLETRLNCE